MFLLSDNMQYDENYQNKNVLIVKKIHYDLVKKIQPIDFYSIKYYFPVDLYQLEKSSPCKIYTHKMCMCPRTDISSS